MSRSRFQLRPVTCHCCGSEVSPNHPDREWRAVTIRPLKRLKRQTTIVCGACIMAAMRELGQ